MNESLSRWVSRPLPRLTLRFEMLLVWSHVHVLAMTELWGGYGENIGNEEERIVQEKRGSFASLVLFVGGLWFRVGGCLCLCVCSWNGSVSMLELCAALYSISPQISAHNREIDIGSSLSLSLFLLGAADLSGWWKSICTILDSRAFGEVFPHPCRLEMACAGGNGELGRNAQRPPRQRQQLLAGDPGFTQQTRWVCEDGYKVNRKYVEKSV